MSTGWNDPDIVKFSPWNATLPGEPCQKNVCFTGRPPQNEIWPRFGLVLSSNWADFNLETLSSIHEKWLRSIRCQTSHVRFSRLTPVCSKVSRMTTERPQIMCVWRDRKCVLSDSVISRERARCLETLRVKPEVICHRAKNRQGAGLLSIGGRGGRWGVTGMCLSVNQDQSNRERERWRFLSQSHCDVKRGKKCRRTD